MHIFKEKKTDKFYLFTCFSCRRKINSPKTILFIIIQATLVISIPGKSILLLISKRNLSPNNFVYTVIVFQLGISQSMDNLKLWISPSGFSVPNCNFHMFQYCLFQSVICRIQETQFGLHGEHWLSHALWEKFKIDFKVSFSQFVLFSTYIICSSQTVSLNCCNLVTLIVVIKKKMKCLYSILFVW